MCVGYKRCINQTVYANIYKKRGEYEDLFGSNKKICRILHSENLIVLIKIIRLEE